MILLSSSSLHDFCISYSSCSVNGSDAVSFWSSSDFIHWWYLWNWFIAIGLDNKHRWKTYFTVNVFTLVREVFDKGLIRGFSRRFWSHYLTSFCNWNWKFIFTIPNLFVCIISYLHRTWDLERTADTHIDLAVDTDNCSFFVNTTPKLKVGINEETQTKVTYIVYGLFICWLLTISKYFFC